MIATSNCPAPTAVGSALHEPRSELAKILDRNNTRHFLRLPLELTALSLEHTSAFLEFPLGVGVVAPRALDARDIELVVLQPWCAPFRLAQVVVRLPTEYLSLAPSDLGVAIQSVIINIMSKATLRVPCISTTHMLRTVLRDYCDPKHGRCVLVEMPLPTGITLRPGAAITLTASFAGSLFNLRIPATGHIHTASCNHSKTSRGALMHAAHAGDIAALEALLAGGVSTEDTDDVSGKCGGAYVTCVAQMRVLPLPCPAAPAPSFCCMVRS